MFIKRVYIESFGCLKNFNIEFSDIEKSKQNNSEVILIGKNGSGKSTFLEAILRIFASFDLRSIAEEAIFDYEIEYLYAQHEIYISCKDNLYNIMLDGGKWITNDSLTSAKRFLNTIRSQNIFPQRVITFYSGSQDRLSPIVARLERSYKFKCLKAIKSYVEHTTQEYLHDDFKTPKFSPKKYISCNDKLTEIYFLSLLGNRKKINIESIASFIESFREQEVSLEVKFSLTPLTDVIKDNIFRNREKHTDHYREAIQDVMFNCLDFLDPQIGSFIKENALFIPTKLEDRNFWEIKDIRKEDDIWFKYDLRKSLDFSFIISNFNKVKSSTRNIYDFFEKMHTLFNAKFKILSTDNFKNSFTIDRLSEGERQLIKLLGIAIIAKEEKALILVDEIDAHMNPQWKYNIKSMIEDFFTESDKTQIFMATHDPLVINGVDAEHIRIFEKSKEGKVVAHEPIEETKGMGIDAILQSEYYGLKNSYDKDTADKFLERQELYLKLITGEANQSDKNKLRELSSELGSLPFASNTIDFIYDDFMQEFKKSEFYDKEYLSVEEIHKRSEEITEIIETLFKEKGA